MNEAVMHALWYFCILVGFFFFFCGLEVETVYRNDNITDNQI